MKTGRLRGAKVFRSTKGKTPDKGVWISFLFLLVTGLIVLYAASFYNAQDQGSALDEVYSQLMGIALGAVFMLIVWKIDIDVLQDARFGGAMVIISLVLLILVAIPGVGVYINGSRRWLRFGPVSFQPSELAKYSMILFLARALSRPERNIENFLKGLLPLFAVPGVMFVLILMQPNLSTAGSVVIVAAVMVLMAGARWLHLFAVGAAGLCVGAYYALSEPYRRARMISFTDPFRYLSDEGYQLSQSLMAFGSGGLFGMGIGRGRQKYSFLPYPESDFIFAVVGEDAGLIGCIGVMTMFFLFLFFSLRVAIREKDRFRSLLAASIAAMIGVQTVLNIAVVVGIMPTTGLPLPLFSAGGTSVSVVMGAIGIIMNISSEQKIEMD